IVTGPCAATLRWSVAMKVTIASPVSAPVGVQSKRPLAGFPVLWEPSVPGPIDVSVTWSPASGSRAHTRNDTDRPTCASTVDPHGGAVNAGAASPGGHR